MKKLVLIAVLNILFFNSMYSQNKFIEFVNSFPINDRIDIIKFGKIVQTTNKNMSKKDAIDFVYHGDSTKLYCLQPILEESEKIVGETNTLLLPQKCFRINTEQYYLIGYTSYECLYIMAEITLNLKILDQRYNIRDSLVVYKGNDFFSDIKGLLNPVNKIIFILREKHGYCYKVNPQTMKFELIKEQDNITGATDNLEKVLEKLGWKEEFLGKENK